LHDVYTLWLIANGSGIGPYLSMLGTDTPWQRFKSIKLVHGVRFAADLAYGEQIATWQQRAPQQFQYLPIVTREQPSDRLFGRIPDLIESGSLERAAGFHFDNASQVMLCGNPDMIRTVKAQLDARGLPKNLRRKPGNVTMEHYW